MGIDVAGFLIRTAVFVAVLGAGAVWVARWSRRRPHRSGQVPRVLWRARVSRGVNLVVLDWSGTRYLVCVGPGGATVLGTADAWEPDPAGGDPIPVEWVGEPPAGAGQRWRDRWVRVVEALGLSAPGGPG